MEKKTIAVSVSSENINNKLLLNMLTSLRSVMVDKKTIENGKIQVYSGDITVSRLLENGGKAKDVSGNEKFIYIKKMCIAAMTDYAILQKEEQEKRKYIFIFSYSQKNKLVFMFDKLISTYSAEIMKEEREEKRRLRREERRKRRMEEE